MSHNNVKSTLSLFLGYEGFCSPYTPRKWIFVHLPLGSCESETETDKINLATTSYCVICYFLQEFLKF